MADMTGEHVLRNRVRILLGDETEPYNVEWDVLLRTGNDGVREIIKRCPEARMAADGTLRTITHLGESGESNLSGTYSIDDYWMEALVRFVVWRIAGDRASEKVHDPDLSRVNKELFDALCPPR